MLKHTISNSRKPLGRWAVGPLGRWAGETEAKRHDKTSVHFATAMTKITQSLRAYNLSISNYEKTSAVKVL